MEYVYYTLTGITLYLISDWLLERVETAYGGRFKYRSLIFLAIIMTLALITSKIFILYTGGN